MLTQKYLKERFHYDPGTGVFTWLTRPVRSHHDRTWNTRFAGTQAGSLTAYRDGKLFYLIISIDGKGYKAHRLAWLYMTGEFPPRGIDHEDRNGLNNRWKNLRPATGTQNQGNRGINSNNTTGFKGVCRHKRTGRCQAGIRVRGKSKYLGSFDTAEDAHAAYVDAAEKHFGKFARTA